MKIAFCISGHLRHYQKLKNSYEFLKEHISEYGSIDTFICTWDKLNTDKSWSHAHGLSMIDSNLIESDLKEIEKFYKTKEITILNEEFYASNYSPLNYENLTHNKYNWDTRGIYNSIPHCVKTCYLIYRCNIMKKYQEFQNQQKYDLVFRLRPDLLYSPKIKDINFLLIESDILYTSSYLDKCYGDFGRFAFGSSDIIDKYANSYLRLSSVFDQNIFGDPEKVYYKSLISMIEPHKIRVLDKAAMISAENPNQKFLR